MAFNHEAVISSSINNTRHVITRAFKSESLHSVNQINKKQIFTIYLHDLMKYTHLYVLAIRANLLRRTAYACLLLTIRKNRLHDCKFEIVVKKSQTNQRLLLLFGHSAMFSKLLLQCPQWQYIPSQNPKYFLNHLVRCTIYSRLSR